MKKYIFPLITFVFFELIAVLLWLTLDNIFYLFNFTYIGTFVSIGLLLHIKKVKYGRLVVQLGVGLYMLVFLGLIDGENMQIEGFWYYLFMGTFQAAVIHYLIAKIAGPFLFGRGWCGYACWTAMVLDFFPYKTPARPSIDKLRVIRYLVFVLALTFVATLFIFNVNGMENIMYVSFIVGNIVYYIVGIILAFVCKDNRAFCKYVCPITIFLKPTSYFSLVRIRVNDEKCIDCGMCKKVCPMEVDMLDNKRSRKNGTECILCMACIDRCPKNALRPL